MARRQAKKANGQGTVYKSRDKFRWQLVLPGREGREGLRIGGTELTREAADLKLVQARADHSRGTLSTARGNAGMGAYLDTFFSRPRGWSESTQRRYRTLGDYAGEFFGDTALDKIRPADVRRFTTWLAARPSKSSRNAGQPIALSTISVALWLLNTVFTEAVSDELMAINPALSVKAPRPGRDSVPNEDAPHKVYSPQEVERFCRLGAALGEAGVTLHWPALFTTLSLGLRRGETAALRWSDIDFERKTVSIRQSRNFMHQNTAPKTKSSRRTIPLPASLAALLSDLPKQHEAVFAYRQGYPDPNLYTHAMTVIQRWSDPQKLDDNLRGVRQQGLTLGREVAELIEGGDALPKINVHGLRHTYATLALRRGVPIEIVSKTLGHAQISMTFDTYRHVLDSELKERSIDLFSFGAQD